MIGWQQFVYCFVCGSMLMMSALGIYSAAVTPSLSRWERRFFSIFFGALAIASATFFLELAAYEDPSLVVLTRVAYFIQTLCAMIPFPMLAVYLLRYCGEDSRKSPLIRIELAIFVALCVLLLISPFTTAFYDVAPNAVMVRGPAYILVLALIVAMLLAILVAVFRRRDKLSRRHFQAFLICLVPVTIALFIHFFVDVFALIDATLTISAYSAYHIIVSEAVEHEQRQQRQIASQRASISVLQMRPHFIYNTMTSVYYLCDQDPQLAKKVIMDFTVYLRKNLAAMAKEEPILFSEELEHARAYLAVEQAQFEDDLFVNFDTPHASFRIPPLTLQPLVENAVKHGMDLDSGPLHIWVRTNETKTASEIIVEDDGPGFDPAIADNPNTTLANIKHRLDIMCGGTMDIVPREGSGTRVLVTIPQQQGAAGSLPS